MRSQPQAFTFCALDLSATISTEREDAYISEIVIADPSGRSRCQVNEMLRLPWDLLQAESQDDPQQAPHPLVVRVLCDDPLLLRPLLEVSFPLHWHVVVDSLNDDAVPVQSLNLPSF